MSQKLVIITVILLIIIVVVFLFVRDSGVEVDPILPSVTHPADSVGLVSFLEDSEQMIAVRSPTTIFWDSGESGSFALGLENTLPSDQTFYITVIKETGPSAGDWLSYPSKKTLSSGEASVINIVVIPTNPAQGTYQFRIFVCTTQDCESLNAASLYATTTFSIVL